MLREPCISFSTPVAGWATWDANSKFSRSREGRRQEWAEEEVQLPFGPQGRPSGVSHGPVRVRVRVRVRSVAVSQTSAAATLPSWLFAAEAIPEGPTALPGAGTMRTSVNGLDAWCRGSSVCPALTPGPAQASSGWLWLPHFDQCLPPHSHCSSLLPSPPPSLIVASAFWVPQWK